MKIMIKAIRNPIRTTTMYPTACDNGGWTTTSAPSCGAETDPIVKVAGRLVTHNSTTHAYVGKFQRHMYVWDSGFI